jgi:hypothetical protein
MLIRLVLPLYILGLHGKLQGYRQVGDIVVALSTRIGSLGVGHLNYSTVWERVSKIPSSIDKTNAWFCGSFLKEDYWIWL